MRLRSLMVPVLIAGATMASFISQQRLLAAPPEATNQTVMLSLKVVDVDRSKLRAIGFDCTPSVEPNQPQPFGPLQTLEPDSVLPDLLDLLTSKKLAKVIASPNICVAVGNPNHPTRPAVYRVGSTGKARLKLDGKEVVEERLFQGIEAVCSVPSVHANGDLQIEFKLRLASFVPWPTETTVYPDGSLLNPRLKSFSIDTGFQLAPGHTLVLSKLVFAEKPTPDSTEAAHEIARLVLVTAQMIEVDEAATPRVVKAPSTRGRSDGGSK